MSILDSPEAYQDPDQALRDLLERQHLIVQMEATEGWTLWRDYVALLASGYQNRLLKGKHPDMLDYKYDAGVVEGIRIALGASEKLQSQIAAVRANLREAGLLANQEDHDEPAVV